MSEDRNDRTVIERADPLVGTVLDQRYRLEFRLAAGGFGAIYRARDCTSGLEVAIKIVHARLAADPGVIARFRREGATLKTLRCPHTITAYEVGETPDGTLYIVLELLRGVTLFERFRVHGKLPWRQTVAIARAVCESLAEAHALGIVHRDLKPTNIHLEPDGENDDFVKVLDFGIAKILQDSRFDNRDVTLAGQMIGTIDYMSPEQMVGGMITGASDVYTLAIVMYEMIAGRRPFAEATSASSALAAVLKPPPPLSSLVIVPAELDRVVLRCLDSDQAKRYDAKQLAAELDRVLGATRSQRDEDATIVTRPVKNTSPTIAARDPISFDREPTDVSTDLNDMVTAPRPAIARALADRLSESPESPPSDTLRGIVAKSARPSRAALMTDATIRTAPPEDLVGEPLPRRLSWRGIAVIIVALVAVIAILLAVRR